VTTAALLLALGVASGVGMIAAAVLPARRERLAEVIARIDAVTANADHPVARVGWWRAPIDRLTASCARSTSRWLTIPAADLALLDQTPAAFTARRLAAAGIAAAAAALAAPRLLPVPQLPIAAVAGAALGWVLPGLQARRWAGRARVEFVAAIAVLCDLTAQERDAGRAPAQAITEAATVAEGWVSLLVRARLRSAQRLGVTAWAALAALGEQVEVRPVADLAEIIATAADGAAISRALRDKATALRAAAIQADTATANARVEWLVWPVGLLVIGMLLLVLRGITVQTVIP